MTERQLYLNIFNMSITKTSNSVDYSVIFEKRILNGVLKETIYLIPCFFSFTFLEIKNSIPLVIWRANKERFLGPIIRKRSVDKDGSSMLYNSLLFRKNILRSPWEQYSIIIHRSEHFPAWENRIYEDSHVMELINVISNNGKLWVK